MNVSRRRALTVWSLTLGAVVAAGAVGTIVLYALRVETAFALLWSTVLLTVISLVFLAVVAYRYRDRS